MRKYKNTVTGAVINVSARIRGAGWTEILPAPRREPEPEPEPVQEEKKTRKTTRKKS